MSTDAAKPTEMPTNAQLEQMQVMIIIETLPALSAHPDFQAGLQDAQACFLEDSDAAPLTEEEMIEKVETNLSHRAVKADRRVSQRLGDEPPSYFYNLGFIFGTLNEGLTYAFQVC
jgi:hypothetical protein